MEWTTEFPEEAGFYWIRNFLTKCGKELDFPPYPHLRIVWIDDDLSIAWIGIIEPATREEIAMAEWYGPIDPPE